MLIPKVASLSSPQTSGSNRSAYGTCPFSGKPEGVSLSVGVHSVGDSKECCLVRDLGGLHWLGWLRDIHVDIWLTTGTESSRRTLRLSEMMKKEG